MTRREAFSRVRSQVLLVRRLGEQMKEISGDGVRSLRLDAAGGGHGGSVSGLEVRLEKREALERIMRRESALLRTYEQEARRFMDGMKPGMYAFCAMYYLGGFSVEESSRAIDRSWRHCMRYKREIEGA